MSASVDKLPKTMPAVMAHGPHDYRFELSVQSQTRPMLVDWTFNLTDFKFNVPLDAKQFVIGTSNE